MCIIWPSAPMVDILPLPVEMGGCMYMRWRLVGRCHCWIYTLLTAPLVETEEVVVLYRQARHFRALVAEGGQPEQNSHGLGEPCGRGRGLDSNTRTTVVWRPGLSMVYYASYNFDLLLRFTAVALLRCCIYSSPMFLFSAVVVIVYSMYVLSNMAVHVFSPGR